VCIRDHRDASAFESNLCQLVAVVRSGLPGSLSVIGGFLLLDHLSVVLSRSSWVVAGCIALVGCSGEIDSGGVFGAGGSNGTGNTGSPSSTTGFGAVTSSGSQGGAPGASGVTSGAGGIMGAGGAATGAGGSAGTGGRGAGGAIVDAGRPDARGGAGGTVVIPPPDAAVGCGKRGLASVLAIASAPQDLAALSAPTPGASWFYSWAQRPSAQVGTSYTAGGFEWVPMVWGHPAELTDTALASKLAVGPGTKYVLGYNEPNFTAQSNLTPAQAAAGWPRLQAAADTLGLKIVGPAVNFCGGGCNQTDPFVWMDQFLAACVGCRIDYLAFHSYACDSNWFINTYMRQAIDKYYTRGTPPRQLWLTELACADAPPAGGWTVAQIQAYQQAIIPFLESQPAIFRYAWFGDTTGRPTGTYVTPNDALLAGAGQLTALGNTYTTTMPGTSCP